MPEAIPFGIGCFAFESPANPNDPVSLEAWGEGVRKGLEDLPQLDDVQIHLPCMQTSRRGSSPEAAGDADRRDYMVPHPVGAVVDFRLRIPTRIQHEEAPMTRGGWRVPGEQFRVTTRYDLAGPVTFVSCLDPNLDPLVGSTAMIVVWKHLTKHLEKATSLQFSVIGPSPMHVRTVLQPRQQETGIAWDQPFQTASQEAATFYFSPAAFADPRDAENELYETISRELSTYYLLVRARNRRLFRASAIGSKTANLIEAHRAPGFRGMARRLFRTGAQARSLGLEVLDAEFRAAQDEYISNERISLLYGGGDGPFANFVREVSAESFTAYTENARSVVELLESSRTKEFEVAVVGASTLLGATAGALASVLT